jgi:hydrogenase/urease accessory protein HupE
MKRLGIAAALVFLALARPLSAHPIPFSYLDLRLQPNVVEGALIVHDFDVAHELNLQPPERLLDPALVAQHAEAIVRFIAGRLEVTADGRALTPQWSAPEVVADRQSIRLLVRFALDRAPGAVAVTARLFPYDPNHQTFVNIYEGEALTQAILDGSRGRFEYFSGTRQGVAAVVQRFVPAGIHHILIGPDHLLFLVGLLLLGGTIRQLALVVTAFTVAHSITLSLAALNLVSPPARIIEPAIALSIVYVGADNLLVHGGRDMRAWIAFAFGFIHGFGFANVLREMDLPSRALGWSLFAFNFGVEIGQLLVVLLVASAFAALRARSEAAGRWLLVAGSAVVVIAGAFWFVQRVFFPGGMQ